jgi:hypothetical protein
MDLNDEIPKVTVSQLSDCAFIWGEEISNVLRFAFRFMHKAIDQGILSRGGLAFGEIIETEQIHSLGRLIVGNAVTQAVALEGYAKGARILINQELPSELYGQDKGFSNKIYQMFLPFTNLLDYQVYDEFKWYLTDDLDKIPDYGLSTMSLDEKIAITKQRLKLANKIQHSELFNWNALTSQGSIQLQATSNFLSENYLVDVFHCFEGKPISKKRSENNVTNMNRFVENDTYFKLHIKAEDEECGD